MSPATTKIGMKIEAALNVTLLSTLKTKFFCRTGHRWRGSRHAPSGSLIIPRRARPSKKLPARKRLQREGGDPESPQGRICPENTPAVTRRPRQLRNSLALVPTSFLESPNVGFLFRH